MTTRSEEFILTDQAGEEHKYRVDVHPSREGSDLMLALCSILSEPFLQGIRLVTAEMEQGKAFKDVDISKILRKADLSDLGGSLRTAVLSLDGDILHAFFKYTYRDGERLAGQGAYDRAYAGNWGEWSKALWKIIKVNGFLHFLSTMLVK